MPIKLAVLISDTHAGSTVGLAPPELETHEGQRIKFNAVQAWFYQCWIDATTKWLPSIVGRDPWALILAGDLIEGDHHRTKQIHSNNVDDHVAAATLLLDPLAKQAAHTLVVRGTECHTHNSEEHIGRALKSMKFADTGRHSTDKLYMEIHECPIVVNHHISATSRIWLEASAFSIFLIAEQAEQMRAGRMPPRVLVSGHRHRFGCFENGHGMTIVCPPWQASTRHTAKAVPMALPMPGIVVLDWRNRAKGELPQVHSRTYRPPPANVVKL